MKKVFKILMRIILWIIGFIVAIVMIISLWQSLKNFRIGLTMDNFTEVKTQWVDIDFTTAIKGETPFISYINNKPCPALEKYHIGIDGTKNVILGYGGNGEEMENNWDVYTESYDVVAKNEQAYIFRSTDDGKTFEKISLGHGTARNLMRVNSTFYVIVDEQDIKKEHYYRSSDLGKTWVLNEWMPTSALSDGTLFIEKYPDIYEKGVKATVTISQDNGKTWHPLSSTMKEFYNKTESLQQLNDHTLVGMTEKKEFLFLDLKTMKIEKKVFETPENKKISGFAISNHQLGLELEEYTTINNDITEIQTSYYFPETKEYVNLPKELPYVVYWDVKEDYIGGIMHYGHEVFGTIVHVYTLDRGRHWKYEIMDQYSLMTASAYIDGQFWFVALNDSAGGIFLIKGKIE